MRAMLSSKHMQMLLLWKICEQLEKLKKNVSLQKKQSAKERASQYSSKNMRAPKDMSQDQTGGAASRYADKFGAGNNTYKGKGFQEFDFTGGSSSCKGRR